MEKPACLGVSTCGYCDVLCPAHHDIALKSFNEIDVSAMVQLPIITVYNHPKDYPDKYVARLWNGQNNTHTNYIVLSDDIDGIRKVVPPGMVCLPPTDRDDPVILETWV